MALVAILDPDVHIVAAGGAVRVERGGETLQTIPTHRVSEVHLHGHADLTAPARLLLLRAGIDVVFFTSDGRLLGRLSAYQSRQGERRLAQYALSSEPSRRLPIARTIISAKLTNQRRMLLRGQRRSPDEDVAAIILVLRGLGERALGCVDAAELLGVEGLAAQRYFDAFGRSLHNPAFRFDGRNRHPPRDPVNACLSFGYTLLLSQVERAVRRAGLDPILGVLHETGRGAPALALDLMEEWRPLVDRMVLSLIHRHELGPEDFRIPPAEELGARAEMSDDAIYLDTVGRQVLLRAWEDELNRRVERPADGDHVTVRDALLEQALAMARVIDGEADTYTPITLEG